MELNLGDARLLAEENEELEQKVRLRVEQVVSEILAHLKGVVSVALIGTLGRGEGIWKVNNGQAKLTSDLDLLVVTDSPRTISRRLVHLSYEGIVDIPVTINLASEAGLKKRRKDTYSVDLRTGSRVVWGRDVVKDIPEPGAEDIGLKDVFNLFFNRALFSVIDLSLSDFTSANAAVCARLSHEASKMVATCADAVTIASGKYTASTRTRLRITRDEIEGDRLGFPIDRGEFAHLVEKTIEFNADKNSFYVEDAGDYWFRARQCLLEVVAGVFRNTYSHADILDTPVLSSEDGRVSLKYRAYLCSRLLRLRRLPVFIGTGNPVARWRGAVLGTFLAVDRDGPQENLVALAERQLSRIYLRRRSGGNLDTRWVHLRDELKRLRFEHVFI